jgi:hypothetical protein
VWKLEKVEAAITPIPNKDYFSARLPLLFRIPCQWIQLFRIPSLAFALHPSYVRSKKPHGRRNQEQRKTGDSSVNDDDLRDWYLALTDSRKQIFLALVSSDLTIHGRGFGLDLSGEEQSRAFKGLNELQHQLSGHIVALGLGRDRYPDDVLWQILTEKAAAYGLSPHLRQSLDFARSRSLWDKVQ